ncbi:hypothetical protein [Microvirus mar23]|uniref:Uncharacterized protein n=1 Tax=Microvirus mar23 TaxID=2851156 RepID=A0A8F5MK63_9VIRU|nr:hypothetical protein [Microvirus mar23]
MSVPVTQFFGIHTLKLNKMENEKKNLSAVDLIADVVREVAETFGNDSPQLQCLLGQMPISLYSDVFRKYDDLLRKPETT